jgi:hypothetical protein
MCAILFLLPFLMPRAPRVPRNQICKQSNLSLPGPKNMDILARLTPLLSDQKPRGGRGGGGEGNIFHLPLGMFYVCGYNFKPNSTFLVLHYYQCPHFDHFRFWFFPFFSFQFSSPSLFPFFSLLFLLPHTSFSYFICSALFKNSCSFLFLRFTLLLKIIVYHCSSLHSSTIPGSFLFLRFKLTLKNYCLSLFLPPLFAKHLFIPSL